MQPHYRQGDLLVMRQEMRPAADLPARSGNIIVAGEATSHADQLTAGQIWQTREGLLDLGTVAGSLIVHEEHAVLELSPGYRQVIRQREYSPSAIRWVRD
jgi:hypothetical protein